MALGQHVLNPGDALPLPLGEVDLRSKDGEGLSFIQQKERSYETIYCHRKRRGRAAFPLCPERDARSPHQPAVQELPQQAGQKGAPEDRLKAGDLIELYINDEFFPPEGAKPAARNPAPKKQQNQPKVTVIYEDENIAVLYKPTHLLCHSDRTGDANLVDAFTQYLAQKGEYDAGGENRFKPGICNRLDRGTEGLVIAAKSYAALRDMNEIIRTDLLKKEYYTITVGIPQSGRFTAWWEHDEKNNKVSIHAHQAQDEHRKQIITDVDVLRTAGPFALCKIGLITGRTHQIRAHLAYLGKPVLGDIKYGNRKMNERTGTRTQALCAVRISFLDIPEENALHYLTGKVIKLKDPQIVKQFDALDKNKEGAASWQT